MLRAMCGLMGVALLLAVGCRLFHDTIPLNNADSGRSIVISVHDQIKVTLGTVGPGQYDDPILSSDAVQYVGQSTPGPPVPAGVRQEFRFEGVRVGHVDLTIPHSGEFAQGPPTPPFTLKIEVH